MNALDWHKVVAVTAIEIVRLVEVGAGARHGGDGFDLLGVLDGYTFRAWLPPDGRRVVVYDRIESPAHSRPIVDSTGGAPQAAIELLVAEIRRRRGAAVPSRRGFAAKRRRA